MHPVLFFSPLLVPPGVEGLELPFFTLPLLDCGVRRNP